MGCGSSKAVQVVSADLPLPAEANSQVSESKTGPRTVVVEAAPPSPTPSTKSSASTSSRRRRDNRESSHRDGQLKKTSSSRSLKSLASLRAEEKAKREEIGRSSSRTSLSEKVKNDEVGSKHSIRTDDSGLGDDNVITENSKADKRESVEKEERPPTPELCITGKGLQESNRSYSAGSRRSLPNFLQPPDNDTSIVQRPASRGGMAFDIVLGSPETGNKPRPPSRLRQLPRSHSANASGDRIKAKLAAAEQRRMQYEKENKIQKVVTQRQKKEQVQQALQEFAAHQAKVMESKEKKRNQTTEKKEAQMKARREQLQKREEHAAKVRQSRQHISQSPVEVH